MTGFGFSYDSKNNAVTSFRPVVRGFRPVVTGLGLFMNGCNCAIQQIMTQLDKSFIVLKYSTWIHEKAPPHSPANRLEGNLMCIVENYIFVKMGVYFHELSDRVFETCEPCLDLRLNVVLNYWFRNALFEKGLIILFGKLDSEGSTCAINYRT